MISAIEIEGFKRFHRGHFDLAPLTILAGLNGSGKTSLIHALLLMCEASNRESTKSVRLNGPFDMELGTAEDVRNWASGDTAEFRLSLGVGSRATWKMRLPTEGAMYLDVVERPEPAPEVFSGKPRAFTYLCAERMGPRNISMASPLPPDALEVGVRGAYCAQMLATLGNKPLPYTERLYPTREENSSSLLKYEVERWLGEVARPVEIDAAWVSGSIVTVLRFRSPGADWVRAPNMGFGVSYALPVILAGLMALRGGLFIVENPEAHLHPAGQSRMGVFLAWLAGRGVQVIVESHSDHVMNGVRRAIGEHKYLPNDSAIVQFFEGGDASGPVAHRLGFTSIGGISHWPPGFFDQYQIDVQSLGRIRRGG